MTDERPALHLFDAAGVELEYMLVDRESLAVRPAVDEILRRAAGSERYVSAVEREGTEWSNELVLHVVELKTAGPAPELEPLPALFARDVTELSGLAAELGALLLPTGMHPFMTPETETRLWPHEHSPVYRAYDRVFGCRGHGWSNLQSTHLNLPFHGDGEFGRLHAGIRLLLPLLPALAASTPVVEGRVTGLLDNRLEAYRTNSRAIPQVVGEVIPEPVYTRMAYEAEILQPAYAAVAPKDPEGVLRDEFLNARGAIARFGRGSIEIRLLDSQENPRMDLAVVVLVVAVLKLLARERWRPLGRQKRWPVAPLARLFRRTLAEAEDVVIVDRDYLAVFGAEVDRARAGELWRHLAAEAFAAGVLDRSWEEPLSIVFEHGTLARRVLRALGDDHSRERIAAVYRDLARCLTAGEPFVP